MIGVVEHYSLETLKDIWKEYIKGTNQKGRILETAAEYPGRATVVFDHETVSKWNAALGEHILSNPRASMVAAENTVQEMQSPETRVPLRVVVVNVPDTQHRRPLDLRVADLGRLVAVDALVATVDPKTGKYAVAVFQCMRCGAIHRIEQTVPGKRQTPIECYKENNGCSRPAGSTKFRCLVTPAELPDPFLTAIGDRDVEFSDMVDEQWMDVQDLPGDLRGREVPSTLRCRIEGRDLVGTINPGDVVTLYGVLRVDDSKGSASPELYFEVNHSENHTLEYIEVTEEDRQRLGALVSRFDKPLLELLVPSLAPHVYGLTGPKLGLTCQLLGGLDGNIGGKKLRWMMHILLVGDPGTGKSMLLKHISKLVPRGSYVDAKMASRAGLVVKAEQVNGKWVARPGPVVLSGGSVCCVDELDKMAAEDITMLNEVTEHGEVHFTKAGAGRFPAETAILAAMNPKGGKRYGGDFHGEVEIEDATMSRFTMIYIITDTRDADDGVRELVRPYYSEGGEAEIAGPLLDDEDMRKFIAIARPMRPKLTPAATELVEEHHKTLRTAEHSTWSNRVLEDLYRLSVAVAKSRLSETVTVDDVKLAIDIHSMAAWGEIHGTGEKIDIEHLPTTGSQQNRHKAMLNLLEQLDDPNDKSAGVEFKVWARESQLPLDEFQRIVKRLHEDCKIVEIRFNTWKVA